MILGAPLEDARHLAQRYSRMRQEAETQVMAFHLISLYRYLSCGYSPQDANRQLKFPEG